MVDQHIHERYAICPYCEEAEHGYELVEEGDSAVVTCEGCGREYQVICDVIIEYRSLPSCSLNGLDHKWAYSSEYRYCTECDESERNMPA